MKRVLFALVVAVCVCCCGSALAEVKVVNEQVGDSLSHMLECQNRGDLQVSPLPGFLQILISTKPIRDLRHLPLSDIKQIDQLDYGVYITWKTERMKNGKGYMTTTVYVPKKVQPPPEVLEIVKRAITSSSMEGGKKASNQAINADN